MGAGSAAIALLAGALAGMSSLLALGAPLPRAGGARAPAHLWGAVCALPPVASLRAAESRAGARRDCLAELPVLLDVVTLGLSAGLSFDSALELYCERSEGELARAFSRAMLSWRIGTACREEALARLADELDVAAIRRFASVVAESLAFGTPLAEALERQAHVIREEQRAQVEEEIERVPVKMLVPLGTLIVPAMFLAILGPLLGSVLVAG